MSQNCQEMNAWKQFQGTELGSVLAGLYGNQNKPKINYPKPKTSKQPIDMTSKKFIPGGANPNSSDPRQSTRKNVNILVPKFSSNSSHLSRGASYSNTGAGIDEVTLPIQIINRRKSAESIKIEMDDIRMRQTHYRPAYSQPYSSESEKERLNQIFTFKGGKALPEELTNPTGIMPLELAEKRKEKEQLQALRMKRGLSTTEKQLPTSSDRRYKTENEEFIDQIQIEIDERLQHIQEMKQLNMLKPSDERNMRLEIANKIEEIKSLTR